MDNLVFSSPTVNDIETLWKWGEENWELWADEKNKWFTQDSLKKWIIDPKDDVLIVAKITNSLVGMAMTFVLRDWGFCCGLYVDKEFRRKGIGKKLLDKTVEELKKKNVDSFSLLVDTKNEDGARFYEREKFYKGFSFFMMTKDVKEDL